MKPKIFIVEDQLELRQAYYDLVKQSGFEATTISKDDELFNILKTERPDLIVLGIGRDEKQTLSILQGLPLHEGNRIPTLVLARNLNADLEKKAMQSGAADVMDKAAPQADVLQRMQKILHHHTGETTKSSASASQKQILIVDDDPSIRKLLALFFERKGFEILQASSGEEAIGIVKQGKVLMVLLDVTMPGMDGLITLKMIKEINPAIGVVMATGIQDEAIAQQATQLGAYAYVMKPFDMQYLDLVVTTRLLLSV